jgi:predicted lipase
MTNISDIDERLAERLTNQEDLGKFIDRIDDTVRTTCTEKFKQHKSLKKIKQKGNQSLGGGLILR